MNPISLPNGYILRTAVPADVDGLLSVIRTNLDEEEWARVLIDGTHPTTNLNHWTVVEDPTSQQVVSTMCMIPQTWTYAGHPFSVARLDMVATDPAHRWKGLVRAQFRALEAESTAQGNWIQVVVGRPYVYRRLGYAMALPYGIGTEVSRQGLPLLKEGETESFHVRPALESDLPYWTELFRRNHDNALVACRREQIHWQHDIFERKVTGRIQLRMIEDVRAGSPTFGRPVGGMAHAEGVNDGILAVFACAVEPGISWLEAAPGILRYLVREGERYTVRDGGEINGFWIGGQNHPMLAALTDHMQRVPPEGPFAWYVRLPDPAGFLMHIAPAIHRRIAGSVIDGWTGELALQFYQGGDSGLTLRIERGCLVRAENAISGWDHPGVPFEYFLKILFGYRSVDEIEAECAEVALNGRSRAILKALFPKQPSRILSIA